MTLTQKLVNQTNFIKKISKFQCNLFNSMNFNGINSKSNESN